MSIQNASRCNSLALLATALAMTPVITAAGQQQSVKPTLVGAAPPAAAAPQLPPPLSRTEQRFRDLAKYIRDRGTIDEGTRDQIVKLAGEIDAAHLGHREIGHHEGECSGLRAETGERFVRLRTTGHFETGAGEQAVHEDDDGLLVVDAEDVLPAAELRDGGGGRPFGKGGGFSGGGGEVEGKDRALAESARDGDGAADGTHDAVRDREPEPCASEFARC